MVNPQDATEVVPYLTSAATVVFVQKWLKQTALYAQFVRAFPGADKWAHWGVAAVGSLIAAEGIHMAYTWTAATGGTVTFTIPNLSDLWHGFADWYKVYVLQHFGYEATRHPAAAQLDALTLPKETQP